jgi:hypothetical protein
MIIQSTQMSFFYGLKFRAIHQILFDDSSVSSSEEQSLNVFALSMLDIMVHRYINHTPTYAGNCYIILESALHYNEANFLLHFRIEKESLL